MIRYSNVDIGWGLHRAVVRFATAPERGALESVCAAWMGVWKHAAYRVQLNREWFFAPLAVIGDGSSMTAFLIGDLKASSELPSLGLPDPLESRLLDLAAMAGLSVSSFEVHSRRVEELVVRKALPPQIELRTVDFVDSVVIAPALPPALADALLEVCGQVAREYAFSENVVASLADWPRWADDTTIQLPFSVSARELSRSISIFVQAYRLDGHRLTLR